MAKFLSRLFRRVPTTFKIQRPGTNDNLTWDVVSVMWDWANFYSTEATFRRSIKPATQGQMAFYACSWYLSEVNNGGHHQFFFNSTGMIWSEALRGFKMIGADIHFQVLSDAVSLFPDSRPSTERGERMDQLESIDVNRFDPLDDRIYEIEEDLQSIGVAFIDANPHEFFLDE